MTLIQLQQATKSKITFEILVNISTTALFIIQLIKVWNYYNT